MAEHDTEKFTDRARELLEESVEHLDAATLSKLHRVRNSALKTPSRDMTWFGWASGGALAACLALFVVYQLQTPPPLPGIYEDPTQQATAENMELLEDLEFIAWLVLEERRPEDASSSS